MANRIYPLKKPLRRRLAATDRRGRPYYIEIMPNGAVEVWLQRHRHETIDIQTIHQRATIMRIAADKAQKQKGKVKHATR